MKTHTSSLPTGVPNLDTLLDGGIPRGSLIAVSGAPGSGKTILVQQICFHNASPDDRVLYFGTLSEPTAKLLRNLKQFAFFDKTKIGNQIEFVDLGEMSKVGITECVELITQHLRRVKPTIIVIDSFKVFDDLAQSRQELRTFGYDIAVTLMAWEATTFLIGEYAVNEYQTNPLFSIADGLFVMSQRQLFGEQQRFVQVVKLRGTPHSRADHPFVITSAGIELYPMRTRILAEPPVMRTPSDRCQTRISRPTT